MISHPFHFKFFVILYIFKRVLTKGKYFINTSQIFDISVSTELSCLN